MKFPLKAFTKTLFTSVLFLIFGLFTFVIHPAYAQQLTLSINPPLVETAIKPGKSILVAYDIGNLGDPVVLTSKIRPFRPQGQIGSIVLADEFEGPIRFNLENSNIQLEDEFFLQSREGQQLLLKIRVPEGTPEGDYYYTFFVENFLGKPDEGIAAAQSQARVGSNILITVTETGRVDIQGSIGQLKIDPRYSLFDDSLHIVESTDIIPVTLILQNTGNYLIKPDGELSIEGGFGANETYDILPQNILSQSTRLVAASSEATLENNITHPDSPATLVLQGFYLGKYTIRANVSFGPGTATELVEVEFWAIPFKLIFAALVALIVGRIIVKARNVK